VSAKIIYLSKSRLKRGLQCSKSLYLTLFKKELEPEVNAATQLNFDEGNEVGELARKQFPNGVLIGFQPWERDEACEATRQAIVSGATEIFEAAFSANGLYARVDVLRRKNFSEEWDLIEVKKSSKVKEEHLEDVSIQALTLEEAGIKVKSYQVMHLNPSCFFPDLSNLFAVADVTEAVKATVPELRKKIHVLQQLVASGVEPKQEVGPHCDDPNPCAFREHCWKDFPRPNVFELPGIGPVGGWKLIKGGKTLISDLNPNDFKGKTKTAIECVQSGKRWIEPKPIFSLVKQWKWPLYFLDFETLAPAIPRYNGCKPYSDVPFQFSCHVWNSPNEEVTHFEYLHLKDDDPRPVIAKALAEGFGDEGSVVAYNMSVEEGVLLKLAEVVPQYASKLKSIATRLVDPLPVFRNHVYDPNFNGGFSIKEVAPALVGPEYDYGNLEISDGMAARAMAESIMRGKVTGAEAESLKEALLEYCRQDTIAMVELTKWMLNLEKAA
jgi:hypothetical protein